MNHTAKLFWKKLNFERFLLCMFTHFTIATIAWIKLTNASFSIDLNEGIRIALTTLSKNDYMIPNSGILLAGIGLLFAIMFDNFAHLGRGICTIGVFWTLAPFTQVAMTIQTDDFIAHLSSTIIAIHLPTLCAVWLTTPLILIKLKAV